METNEPVPEGGRACAYCGEAIPADVRNNALYCGRGCRSKLYWQRHREVNLVKQRARYTANAEERRAKHKEWRDANIEKVAASTQASTERRKAEIASGGPRGILAQKRQMLSGARSRAKRGGYPCTITLDDFHIPEVCPVLGIEITLGGQGGRPTDGSPSLDKIIPALGYVPGNCIVTSQRANVLKSDATVAEMGALYHLVLSRKWWKFEGGVISG